MKLTSLFIYYIIPTSLLLCGGPCCPEEEETTYLYIDNHNIISISDNATTFNVDDVIFIFPYKTTCFAGGHVLMALPIFVVWVNIRNLVM